MSLSGQQDVALLEVACPYCGEAVELSLESDLVGEMVWDCEVCCRPWSLTVRHDHEGTTATARTLEE